MEFSPLGILFVLLEFIRPVLIPLAVVAAAELAFVALVLTWRRRLRVRAAMRAAFALGGLAGLSGALLLPVWTQASLADLRSTVDVLAVAGAGAGIGLGVALLVYPPLQLFLRSPR